MNFDQVIRNTIQYCNCLYTTNFGALGDSDSVLPKLFVTVDDGNPIPVSSLIPVINYLLMNRVKGDGALTQKGVQA
jgi:hypothetical protein